MKQEIMDMSLSISFLDTSKKPVKVSESKLEHCAAVISFNAPLKTLGPSRREEVDQSDIKSLSSKYKTRTNSWKPGRLQKSETFIKRNHINQWKKRSLSDIVKSSVPSAQTWWNILAKPENKDDKKSPTSGQFQEARATTRHGNSETQLISLPLIEVEKKQRDTTMKTTGLPDDRLQTTGVKPSHDYMLLPSFPRLISRAGRPPVRDQPCYPECRLTKKFINSPQEHMKERLKDSVLEENTAGALRDYSKFVLDKQKKYPFSNRLQSSLMTAYEVQPSCHHKEETCSFEIKNHIKSAKAWLTLQLEASVSHYFDQHFSDVRSKSKKTSLSHGSKQERTSVLQKTLQRKHFGKSVAQSSVPKHQELYQELLEMFLQVLIAKHKSTLCEGITAVPTEVENVCSNISPVENKIKLNTKYKKGLSCVPFQDMYNLHKCDKDNSKVQVKSTSSGRRNVHQSFSILPNTRLDRQNKFSHSFPQMYADLSSSKPPKLSGRKSTFGHSTAFADKVNASKQTEKVKGFISPDIKYICGLEAEMKPQRTTESSIINTAKKTKIVKKHNNASKSSCDQLKSYRMSRTDLTKKRQNRTVRDSQTQKKFIGVQVQNVPCKKWKKTIIPDKEVCQCHTMNKASFEQFSKVVEKQFFNFLKSTLDMIKKNLANESQTNVTASSPMNVTLTDMNRKLIREMVEAIEQKATQRFTFNNKFGMKYEKDICQKATDANRVDGQDQLANEESTSSATSSTLVNSDASNKNIDGQPSFLTNTSSNLSLRCKTDEDRFVHREMNIARQKESLSLPICVSQSDDTVHALKSVSTTTIRTLPYSRGNEDYHKAHNKLHKVYFVEPNAHLKRPFKSPKVKYRTSSRTCVRKMYRIGHREHIERSPGRRKNKSCNYFTKKCHSWSTQIQAIPGSKQNKGNKSQLAGKIGKAGHKSAKHNLLHNAPAIPAKAKMYKPGGLCGHEYEVNKDYKSWPLRFRQKVMEAPDQNNQCHQERHSVDSEAQRLSEDVENLIMKHSLEAKQINVDNNKLKIPDNAHMFQSSKDTSCCQKSEMWRELRSESNNLHDSKSPKFSDKKVTNFATNSKHYKHFQQYSVLPENLLSQSTKPKLQSLLISNETNKTETTNTNQCPCKVSQSVVTFQLQKDVHGDSVTNELKLGQYEDQAPVLVGARYNIMPLEEQPIMLIKTCRQHQNPNSIGRRWFMLHRYLTCIHDLRNSMKNQILVPRTQMQNPDIKYIFSIGCRHDMDAITFMPDVKTMNCSLHDQCTHPMNAQTTEFKTVEHQSPWKFSNDENNLSRQHLMCDVKHVTHSEQQHEDDLIIRDRVLDISSGNVTNQSEKYVPQTQKADNQNITHVKRFAIQEKQPALCKLQLTSLSKDVAVSKLGNVSVETNINKYGDQQTGAVINQTSNKMMDEVIKQPENLNKSKSSHIMKAGIECLEIAKNRKIKPLVYMQPVLTDPVLAHSEKNTTHSLTVSKCDPLNFSQTCPTRGKSDKLQGSSECGFNMHRDREHILSTRAANGKQAQTEYSTNDGLSCQTDDKKSCKYLNQHRVNYTDDAPLDLSQKIKMHTFVLDTSHASNTLFSKVTKSKACHNNVSTFIPVQESPLNLSKSSYYEVPYETSESKVQESIHGTSFSNPNYTIRDNPMETSTAKPELAALNICHSQLLPCSLSPKVIYHISDRNITDIISDPVLQDYTSKKAQPNLPGSATASNMKTEPEYEGGNTHNQSLQEWLQANALKTTHFSSSNNFKSDTVSETYQAIFLTPHSDDDVHLPQHLTLHSDGEVHLPPHLTLHSDDEMHLPPLLTLHSDNERHLLPHRTNESGLCFPSESSKNQGESRDNVTYDTSNQKDTIKQDIFSENNLNGKFTFPFVQKVQFMNEHFSSCLTEDDLQRPLSCQDPPDQRNSRPAVPPLYNSPDDLATKKLVSSLPKCSAQMLDMKLAIQAFQLQNHSNLVSDNMCSHDRDNINLTQQDCKGSQLPYLKTDHSVDSKVCRCNKEALNLECSSVSGTCIAEYSNGAHSQNCNECIKTSQVSGGCAFNDAVDMILGIRYSLEADAQNPCYEHKEIGHTKDKANKNALKMENVLKNGSPKFSCCQIRKKATMTTSPPCKTGSYPGKATADVTKSSSGTKDFSMSKNDSLFIDASLADSIILPSTSPRSLVSDSDLTDSISRVESYHSCISSSSTEISMLMD